jgi:hypothetical protein
MWSFNEKFGGCLEIAAEALASCRKIKALELERGRLERAATSLLDFELHRGSERGVQAIFETAASQWPEVFQFSLAEIVHHFATLSFAENGGASFAYLWGASAAAESHQQYSDGNQLSGLKESTMVSPKATVPAVSASFEFYRGHFLGERA